MDQPASPTPTHGSDMPVVYTAQDIIAWTRDEAFRLGEIGFTTNFTDPADIFSAGRCDLTAPLEPVDDQETLEAFADEIDMEVRKAQAYCEVMKNLPALMAEAHEIIDAKLLAAGKQKREGESKELRAKVVELYELEHPQPKPNYVTVLVAQGPFSRPDELLQANLPINSYLAEIENLLTGVLEMDETFKNPLGPRKEIPKDGTWKYQVLYRDSQGVFQNINQASVPLETDDDYHTMVERITDADEESFHVVLARETVLQPEVEGGVGCKERGGGEAETDGATVMMREEGEEDDGTYPEPLDEDGNPYFDPVTPENSRRTL